MTQPKHVALSLLDDSPNGHALTQSLSEQSWIDISINPKKELQKLEEIKKITEKKTKAIHKTSSKHLQKQNLFRTPQKASSRKPIPFEKMLKEYNQRAARASKIKLAKHSSIKDFMPENVEWIEVPAITGKVLRPT